MNAQPLSVAGSGGATNLFSPPPLAPPATAQQPRSTQWLPYTSQTHTITRGRYITSKDPRGYIPVWEYHLNGQWLMMDSENGYILWTGIWKALGNQKADVVKMIESLPELSPFLRRVRGGYLKIQGTWMPFEYAVSLARRVAWPIRDDLIPFFGPSFPTTCLSPSDAGYGRVVPPANARRRRRTFQAQDNPVASAPPTASTHYPPPSQELFFDASRGLERPSRTFTEAEASTSGSNRYAPYPPLAAIPKNSAQLPPLYPPPQSQREHGRRWSGSGASSPESATSASTHSSSMSPPSRLLTQTHVLNSGRPTLPPLSSLSLLPAKPLPPISTMTQLPQDRGSLYGLPDPASILRRLQTDEHGARRRHHASE
ncbi:DNA-binding domain of Mlu1-box binding protein MBP1 [Auriculariales sp. MPI-PUGE-AT-0066]|nr:DNA-binding domain of Mlu1-box binding protein MBP1 [Auriculariales sp. MPI-PUGE-AT-0066]